ncbi:MAG TPA: DUF58 domain-containing protein [Bryobacteraceae bacterium]|nr:DUF58 domain-containing protein [Bryobacteraceae bacterium]
MTLHRIRALIHRRVRYRVTGGGILFALTVAVTGAGAFLSANNLLFLIFSAMLALLLVSGFLSRLVLSGLEMELLLPEHVSARTPYPARIRLRNLKRITPSFSIEVAGRRDTVTNTPSILNAPVYFPLLPGRAVLEASVDVTFPRRGRHRENLFVLSTKFPFGFLRKTTMVALRRETIVYPSLEPQPGMELVLEALSGELATNFRGTGFDFYRIRPYEISDSARLVDWKTTAHTGELQVREFSREQQRGVEIFLDRRIAPGSNEWFERAIERCAFVAWELAAQETELLFRSQRFSCAVPGEGEVYSILRYLALVEPIIIAGQDSQPVEPPLDAASIQLVFSARPSDFESAGWQSITGG